jgi:hypothetical protein
MANVGQVPTYKVFQPPLPQDLQSTKNKIIRRTTQSATLHMATSMEIRSRLSVPQLLAQRKRPQDNYFQQLFSQKAAMLRLRTRSPTVVRDVQSNTQTLRQEI